MAIDIKGKCLLCGLIPEYGLCHSKPIDCVMALQAIVKHHERTCALYEKKLAEANDRLARIAGLCENCTNLSDAQAIARGQELDYINQYGHYQTKEKQNEPI